jgi:myo-inositol-1-phosphate synthase
MKVPMADEKADGKLGIWFIGAGGNVATTATLGLLALQQRLAPKGGLVSELPPFAGLPLVEWDQLVVGGHEIRRPNLRATAHRLAEERVVPEALVEACTGDLAAVESRIAPGIAYHCGDAIRQLAEVTLHDDEKVAPRELITRLQADITAFMEQNRLRGAVVVNVASTEPTFGGSLPEAWPEVEPLLDRVGEAVAASTLYAIAALELGLPFVNFTPSVGAALPAIEDLAKRKKICHAGGDGKTGETLLKTVLAPMFAHRNLEVLSWVGHNIFGNLDGRILDNPANRQTKVATKDRVLASTLGYDPQTLVSIEYIESLGDWKTAWDHIHFRGFLGTLMTLQFTWQGSDSALAAPLVLDLVRLVELAARRGEIGAVAPLAAFFKRPLGATSNDFAEQHRALVEWASASAGVAHR